MSTTSKSTISEKRALQKKQFAQTPRAIDNNLHPLVNEQISKDIWLLLLIFRCINAVCVRTFFQPDEYFQSLEPAWQMAFGPSSGAWITWEWHRQLRSSLHPAFFAGVYYVADNGLRLLSCFPQFRAMILCVLPNLVQAYFAAAGDYYTWQLAERIYGIGSSAGWAALFMTMLSPWQWFCSTRTFSNCFETTMTITALYFWPWKVSTDSMLASGSDPTVEEKQASNPANISRVFKTAKSIKHLRISLLLASTACILRPTNALIWFCILMPIATNLLSSARLATSDYLVLIREALLCGTIVLALSATSDWLYFNTWTFPPYQWFNFNISQDLAVFYGRNDWHYYLSQGLPLLTTSYLPFTLVALWNSASLPRWNIQFLFTTTTLVTLATLSLISHKEVRFIYPLLPLLHILTAPTISSFFTTPASTITSTTVTGTKSTPIPNTESSTRRKPLLFLILLLNLTIAGYTSLIHQRAVISVLPFLRHEFELLALDNRGIPVSSSDANAHAFTPRSTNYSDNETFVGFLMPCHSTPWRSQLVHSGLKAWALSCEPPIHLAPHTAERLAYRDEADRFYDAPLQFLRTEINTVSRPWPRYIVGFEGIGNVLKEYYEEEMKGFVVREKWRGKNTHWHDDRRRVGDVVVWEFVDGSTHALLE